MRTEKKVAILVATLMVIVGTIMAGTSFKAAGSNFKGMFKSEEYEMVTKDITESFDDIEINIGDQDLKIKKSDSSKAYLVCYESKNVKFDVGVNRNTLRIEEKANRSFLNYDFINGTMGPSELYLPEDEYNNVTIHIGSGDLYIQDAFKFRDVKTDIGSGDTYLSNLTLEEIKAKIGSGQIWLTGSKVTSADLHTGSGDIAIEDLACKKNFNAETLSGTLFLTNLDSTESLGGKTGSGDIILKSCDSMKMEFKTGSGDVTGSVKTAKTFDADSGSGDVRLPADGNGGTCYIRTGSGDIEIEVEN